MSHTFHGKHLKMHYVEEGEGRAIVFLHGLTMDHTMFAAQFEELPDAYRCIAVDLRGHGRSGFPVGLWAMEDFVADAVEFIEGVDAAPCHLVGMSMGGMIALAVALEREDLVRSLVLIDTSADVLPPPFVEGMKGFMELADSGGVEPVIEGMTQIAFGPRYRENEPDGVAVYHDRIRTMNPSAIVEGLRAITGRTSLAGRLGEVHVPTLVIHGEDDPLPMSGAEATANAIAGGELVKIPGAGHTTPIEAPDEVNAALARFFARVD